MATAFENSVRSPCARCGLKVWPVLRSKIVKNRTVCQPCGEDAVRFLTRNNPSRRRTSISQASTRVRPPAAATSTHRQRGARMQDYSSSLFTQQTVDQQPPWMPSFPAASDYSAFSPLPFAPVSPILLSAEETAADEINSLDLSLPVPYFPLLDITPCLPVPPDSNHPDSLCTGCCLPRYFHLTTLRTCSQCGFGARYHDFLAVSLDDVLTGLVPAPLFEQLLSVCSGCRSLPAKVEKEVPSTPEESRGKSDTDVGAGAVIGLAGGSGEQKIKERARKETLKLQRGEKKGVVKLADMAVDGILKAGDEFRYAKWFGPKVVVAKDVKLLSYDSTKCALSFAHTPSKGVTMPYAQGIVFPGTLQQQIQNEDGRRPKTAIPGNAWEHFTVFRKGRRLGTLSELRKKYSAGGFQPTPVK